MMSEHYINSCKPIFSSRPPAPMTKEGQSSFLLLLISLGLFSSSYIPRPQSLVQWHLSKLYGVK